MECHHGIRGRVDGQPERDDAIIAKIDARRPFLEAASRRIQRPPPSVAEEDADMSLGYGRRRERRDFDSIERDIPSVPGDEIHDDDAPRLTPMINYRTVIHMARVHRVEALEQDIGATVLDDPGHAERGVPPLPTPTRWIDREHLTDRFPGLAALGEQLRTAQDAAHGVELTAAGTVPLILRQLAGGPLFDRVVRRPREPDGQREHCRENSTDEQMISLDELGNPVGRRRRPCPDRLLREVPTDVFRERCGARVATRLVAIQACVHDCVDVPIDRPVDAPEARRVISLDRSERRRERQPRDLQGRMPTDQFEQHRPEGVDIGAGIDVRRLPRELLGCHVRQRSQNLTLPGHGRRGERRITNDSRDAEVEHLGMSLGGDQHVLRLQIAVYDALPMGVLHRVRDASNQHRLFSDPQSVGRRVFVERLALDQFHREVRPRPERRMLDAGPKDPSDPVVPETPECLRLCLESASRG